MGFITQSSLGNSATMVGAATASTTLTAVTSSVSANTKGSWTEISASTPHASFGFHFMVHCVTAGFDSLIDIGIGAGGSEVIIVPNFMFSISEGNLLNAYFPLFIPSGTRIAVRHQASAGSSELRAGFMLIRHTLAGFPLFASCTAYGVNTGDSGGTSVDPGATADTKGAYSEITSSTSQTHGAVMFTVGSASNFVRNTTRWSFDMALGAAASELIFWPDYFIAVSSRVDGDHLSPTLPLFRVIPSGTRLAMRSQSDDNVVTNRTLDVAIYAFS